MLEGSTDGATAKDLPVAGDVEFVNPALVSVTGQCLQVEHFSGMLALDTKWGLQGKVL
jgi:hypothetical protein